MAQPVDDLGHPFAAAGEVRRVVSLVPSLTESVAHSEPNLLVGATQWCTHPADLDVARVRGTKNPDLAAVRALRPDLVLANKEENRKLDVRRLRDAGVAVWVTDITTLDGAFRSLERLFTLALGRPAPSWLAAASASWAVSPTLPVLRAVVPIWRDPWMVVGSSTFTGDVITRLGLQHVYGSSPERYPHVELDDVLGVRPDVVLLPDEPYEFTALDGPEAFPGVASALVSGRELTWYGPSLRTAREHLTNRISAARPDAG